jgi:hypothetical protein
MNSRERRVDLRGGDTMIQRQDANRVGGRAWRWRMPLVGMTVAVFAVGIAVARSTERRVIPRKTGNLTITSYRPQFIQGKPTESPDPILRDWSSLASFGMTSVEDYVTLDVLEPRKGRLNPDPYLANLDACRRLRVGYAIYPWFHFYPDWVEQEPGFTPYTNLENGQTCRQPSGWAPATMKLAEHFYSKMARSFGRQVDAVYVADCADYGELGYPAGYTQWLRADPNARKAWWCGDKYAQADFRTAMIRLYGPLQQLNLRWDTSFTSNGEVAYPPIELLKSNPDPLKLKPGQRRRILDFVYWYQDAASWRMVNFLRIAQSAFPGKPYEIKLGHGDESAILGQSCSSACQILHGTPRLAIRSTHAVTSYFHVKRVSTAAHFFGFTDFLTEPPGTIKPERMAERIFTDACAGATAYFDYPQNPKEAAAAYTENIGLLDGQEAIVDVALLFPEADHYLRIDQVYPRGLLECANVIRDVADFDVVDERMTAAAALSRYKLLIIPGDPLLEDTTCLQLQTATAGARLRVIQIVPNQISKPLGQFTTVAGQERQVLSSLGSGRAITRIVGKPDGDDFILAVQKAYADILRQRGLHSSTVELLTARDQVWTGLFENRILAYNTVDTERTVNGNHLAGRHILEIRRSR